MRGWVKTNPLLSEPAVGWDAVFRTLPRLMLATRGADTGGAEKFVGRRFPTYFGFKGRKDGEPLARTAALGSRARIEMETDAKDNSSSASTIREPLTSRCMTAVIMSTPPTLLPPDRDPEFSGLRSVYPLVFGVGDTVRYLIEVTDPNRWDVFRCELTLDLGPPVPEREPGKPNPGNVSNTGKGSRGGGTSTLEIPNVIPVHESDANWRQYGFTEDERHGDQGSS